MENWFESFENTRVLVVGGAGFVGSNLVKLLLNKVSKVSITVIDNLMSAEIENLPIDHRLTFIKGSISDNKIVQQIKDEFDYVFHLATYHGNQSSIHNPLADHENNTLTTLKLLDWIKDFKQIKKVVYSSAGCSVAKKTFGDAVETTEEDPIELKQDSPYSMSKIFGEFYALYYFNQHRLPTVRARFQNVYGQGEVLGAGQWRGTPATVWRNVTPTFIYKALKGLPLPLENNGVASRDFIYVEDICRGLIACAAQGSAGEVYNLASGQETTIGEWANLINKLAGNEGNITHLPKRAWDNSGKRFGSTQKAKKELDFEVKMPIQEGLKLTIEWTKANLLFIEYCMSKHQGYLS